MTYYHRGHHNPKHNPKSQAKQLLPVKLEILLHGKPDTDRRELPPLSAGAIEAKRLLEVAKQAYVNQQENQMADMKTALSKVINEWDNATPDAPAATPIKKDGRITTGVSQATFDFIKNNPGKTKAVAIRELEEQGYKPTSTTTLISAMVRQGQVVVDDSGHLTAKRGYYTPVKYIPSKKTAKAAKVAKPAPMQQVREETPQGLAALYVQPTPAPVQTTAPAPTTAPMMTAKQVLETLSVKEAFALYRELQSMFDNDSN